MKPTYTKLAADGSDLPADSTEKHLAVRVEHPMLKAPIVVAAYRCSNREVTFKTAQKNAGEHDAYGWAWRAPTVEEAFFIADRTNPECTLDVNFFPDGEKYEWTWTSTIDAESPSDYAWFVGLGYGYCYRGYQSYHFRVRAVRAGQP